MRGRFHVVWYIIGSGKPIISLDYGRFCHLLRDTKPTAPFYESHTMHFSTNRPHFLRAACFFFSPNVEKMVSYTD